ncbi:hypothetical protein STEG23_036814 [Scotinomys teguina]
MLREHPLRQNGPPGRWRLGSCNLNWCSLCSQLPTSPSAWLPDPHIQHRLLQLIFQYVGQNNNVLAILLSQLQVCWDSEMPHQAKLDSEILLQKNQTGLKHRDPPVSAFQELGLKVCTITPSSKLSSIPFHKSEA